MRLSANKEKAFQKLLTLLEDHQKPDHPVTKQTLRSKFDVTSPVYAIFWHHVLYETPIFDVHTNRAFKWFTRDLHLTQRDAAIPRGQHWELYDAYCEWFNGLLNELQKEDAAIDSRYLDRALFRWGFTNSKSLVAASIPPSH